MHEKPFNMPSFKDPHELTHAANELINDNDDIGDSEARWLTAENNRRLAAMLAEMDLEDISLEMVAQVTRRVKSSPGQPHPGSGLSRRAPVRLPAAPARQHRAPRPGRPRQDYTSHSYLLCSEP